jgi:anti-anti-sigma regulatory factor
LIRNFLFNQSQSYSDTTLKRRYANAKLKEFEMGIKNLSENIILLELPLDRLEREDELKNLNEIVSDDCQYDVIVDFSNVEIINSWNISNLLILRGMLEEAGRKLILCDVSSLTKCIFTVAGLSDVLVFSDTRSAALDILQKTASIQTTVSKK